MFKTDLREKYKTLRSLLSTDDIDSFSINIANNVLKLPVWDKTYYHIFLTIEEQKEIDTSFLLSILHGKDKEVVISKSNFNDYTLSHYLLTENTRLKKNRYNIPEPVDGLEVPVKKIDVVFIPLLAFDKKGNRVGYGKGFYDKFLSECKEDTVKIGLSFFEPDDLIEDTNENDIQIDYCITPENIYSFR
ncbi:5-formyltetrahydrofolate cyclo-ligase [Zhouia spongiae]|uniref:5-formyltetrahydrofolate cyclo-ligase n=1 Tax=Zhouia spongiae TaxID=2202721 RepID=A0ABY3YRK3_9FLAO|nr:5-formyltetrahydrofolate cyclo-ligase [Zhouia spongiae]UNZ00453.1 5-formyltetrahydrofolate cyclo-ligase [Zhouia spongiae]